MRSSALEYAIHRAQSRRLLKREDVIDVLGRSPRRQGTAVVRRVLGISDLAADRVRSLLEHRFLRICRKAGLPEPRVNAWIALPGGDSLEVDFSWPDHRLAVETDSRKHHDTDRAFENDPRRDRLLMLADWRVARYTYRDVTERPEEVVAQLWSLLGH